MFDRSLDCELRSDGGSGRVSLCCEAAVSVLLAELFVSEWLKPNLYFAGEILVCVLLESAALGCDLSGINRLAICVGKL